MIKMCIGFLLLLSVTSHAQEKMVADTIAVNSFDGIVKEVLSIISGDEGKVRNWETFRNLFLPTANFTVLYHADEIPLPYETVSLEKFITLMHDEYYDQGFTEYEISKVVDEYNGLAQVFQSFYAKDSENQEVKGITSYQIIFFNNRWWIANTVWTDDSNGMEVPEKYLGK